MNNRDWLMVWREYKVWIVGGVAAVVIALIAWISIRAPRSAAPALQNFQVVGFYQNYNPTSGHPGSESSFEHHVTQLSTVSPRWFLVDPSGAVSDIGYTPSVVRLAHAHHVQVVPLFNNAQGSAQVLYSAAARTNAVNNIVALVKQDHLDGVNIDFELIPASSRGDLSIFIAQLSKQLHAIHKIVAVSVFPLVGVPSSINGAYDYRQLGASANYLVIMTYDHHYSGGPPGPVAPWEWVKQNMDAALKLVPADHLILAIGMYGYDWVDNGSAGPATTVPDESVPSLEHEYGVTSRYNPWDSQNVLTYTTRAGVKHIVYYMGNRSAQARVRLAQSRHLAGVALWRLGFESPGFWTKIPRG
ncbi:MAG: glycoside hydrolase [Sulfobacillus thermosulfidooxidans]|uniref:Glycoside hydrolase n=1 Tax=Sulfobacillus thermotolerans TaxID=338644 RepID=A0ABN5GZH2_9FIRM|nr:glycoside hydrolase [Sulfobacillus thermotolerans]PSR36534.1 MAG: glycoside hydrolase [Sulfobacillus thermosulfidooxidans]